MTPGTITVERVQAGVSEAAHKLLLAGLGAAALIEEQTGELFDRLVERGRGVEKAGYGRVRRLRRRAEDGLERVSRLAGEVQAAAAAPRRVFHLVPRAGGWALKQEDVEAPVSLHATKEEALEAGRALAQGREPSQLVVHRLDGTIQRATSYGG